VRRALADLRVIAHRGASRERPENSIAAFELALEQGADGIELDVQLTRDGVAVVLHDPTLARFGGRRRVAGTDWHEIGEPGPPRLDDVLDRFGRRTVLLIELKAVERGATAAERHLALVETTVRAVRRRRLDARCALLCFDRGLLDVAAGLAPGIPRVLNVSPQRLARAPSSASLAGLDAVSADVRTLAPRWGAAVRHAGLPLLAWTCNTPRRVDAALAAGATGVMSDRPAWLARRLAAATEHD